MYDLQYNYSCDKSLKEQRQHSTLSTVPAGCRYNLSIDKLVLLYISIESVLSMYLLEEKKPPINKLRF